MNTPTGVTEDVAGSTYWADSGNNRIRKAGSNSNGFISTVAGNGTSGFGGDGFAATSAQLSSPTGIAIDLASGAMYIADSGNNRIRKVSGGVITTYAGNGACPSKNSPGIGDGGPATSAKLCVPTGVALDSAGNLYVADTFNDRIRKITPGGTNITTFAGNGHFGSSGDGNAATNATLGFPTGIAVNTLGSVYIADTANSKIRVVTGGTINTFAGTGSFGYNGEGTATMHQLAAPTGIGINGADVFISDTFNQRIRLVASGLISTYAGNGTRGNTGDGGPATSATLNSPTGAVATDGTHVYFSDTGNNRGRAVTSAGPPPVVAETGLILLLPISAVLIGGAAFIIVRRRRDGMGATVPAV
jgi:sugar lactone lactonase YvrE